MLSNNIKIIAAKVLKINKDLITDEMNIVGILNKDEVDLVEFIIELEAQSNKAINKKQFKKLKTIDDIQKYLNEK